MTLECVKWGEFVIGDLFTVEIGKSIDGDKVDKSAGKTPYITRKESNNGLDGFIDYGAGYINAKYPVITIGNETAEPFVQNFPFYTGTKVNILTPKLPQSWQTLLFVAQSLKMHKGKYSYAFTINSTRLRKQVIQLPVDEAGQPDYAFMERFIYAHEHRLIRAYVEQVSVRLRNTPPQKLLSLNGVRWKGFRISDVFVISPGKRLRKEDMTAGDKPFIGASDSNNGVTAFVSNSNSSEDRNILGVNYNGSVVESFYHPYTCLFSDDVKRFRIRDHEGDKYIYEFLKTAILQQKIKYTYGYKFNEQRMQRQIIMLPTTQDGLPDWQLIHNYMLAHESRLLSAVISHFTAKLHT